MMHRFFRARSVPSSRSWWAVPTLLCLIAAAAVTARADEPFGVKLLRPDSLAGWDHGVPAPSGWKIAGGRLEGSGDASPLLSGWTFGPFELRFCWSTADGGAWTISLPEVPDRKGLALVLCEGDGCGAISDGDKKLAPGAKVEATKAKMHTAAIRRSGAKLLVTIDGRKLAEVDVAPARRFGLGLAVAKGKAALADLRLEEPPGKPIFNGKNLDGWWTPGNIEAWKVQNNQITLSEHGGNYIRTKKLYANFTLYADYKIAAGGNSGIGIRTPRDGWPSGDGMEVQLWDKPYDQPLDKHQTMALYGNMPPLARADKSLEWNRVVIKADGRMISAWVGGELVQQVNTQHHPELKHRGTVGWIGFQDHTDGVQFRDVRVLEAPPGMGLAAWQTPRPATGVTALVDRLLNVDKLATDDGIRSAVASVSGSSSGEHVVAELTGPGAIVRIARSGATGRLAFYFDGEPKPRIESDAAGLDRAVPSLPGHRSPVLKNPVLTLLAFRKSVKVVLRDASEGEYRFDYVTFPKGLPVETFTDAEHMLPRGWLSAAVYRTLRLRTNRFRDSDPMPKVDGEPRTIPPGKTVKLVELDAAGVARWIKLKAEKKVLRSKDLWLEVTVDGEKCPAISAPARFWFPGLTGPGGFFNYVLLSREGPTNLLAMPFSGGITLSAKNCGKAPIQNVGAQIYYEPATDRTRTQIAGRMRLRGVFQPAGQGGDVLACRDGRGRWVGLVYAEPDAANTAIQSLVIDGKPAEGWTAARLDGFLGNGSKEFRGALSGRHDGLVWRYLMLAPVDFEKSLVLKIDNKCPGDRLALFYTFQ